MSQSNENEPFKILYITTEIIGINFACEGDLNNMKGGVSKMKITFTREGLVGLSSTILSLLVVFGLLSVT